MKTWVVLNDIQIPFEDRRVLEQLTLPFIEELQPHGVILNGDITDNYQISDFDQDPESAATLEKEIVGAQRLMARLQPVTKTRIWVGGNHEDRWRRNIWRNKKLHRMFKSFDDAMEIKKHGFEWRPYGEGVRLGKLYVTHGSRVNKHSGQTARAHYDKYGVSVLVGHSHRLGTYYHRNMGGCYGAYENGCLCQLDPEYDQHPDWQHGFSVVHVEDGTGLFHVTQIPILRRSVLFYGSKEYRL